MTKQRFYYNGKFYDTYAKFCKAALDFCANQVSYEDFMMKMNAMAEDIFANLKMRDKVPTGGELLEFTAFFFESAITKLLDKEND
jgi:hypothetical protein